MSNLDDSNFIHNINAVPQTIISISYVMAKKSYSNLRTKWSSQAEQNGHYKQNKIKITN